MYLEHKKKQLKLSLGTRDRQERFIVKTAAKGHLCCTFKDENGFQERMGRCRMRLSGWEKGSLPCRRKQHGKAKVQGRALGVGSAPWASSPYCRSAGCAEGTASYHAVRVHRNSTRHFHDIIRNMYFLLQSLQNAKWLLVYI